MQAYFTELQFHWAFCMNLLGSAAVCVSLCMPTVSGQQMSRLPIGCGTEIIGEYGCALPASVPVK